MQLHIHIHTCRYMRPNLTYYSPVPIPRFGSSEVPLPVEASRTAVSLSLSQPEALSQALISLFASLAWPFSSGVGSCESPGLAGHSLAQHCLSSPSPYRLILFICYLQLLVIN